MSDLKPGLYKATVNDVADRIVLVDSTGWGYYSGNDGELLASEHGDFTDARPLIVLDVGGRPNLAACLRKDGYESLARQIEAQTKPARIPEPGMYGVVKSDGLEWTHLRNNTSFDDWVSSAGTRTQWGALPSPTLIREGVTS